MRVTAWVARCCASAPRCWRSTTATATSMLLSSCPRTSARRTFPLLLARAVTVCARACPCPYPCPCPCPCPCPSACACACVLVPARVCSRSLLLLAASRITVCGGLAAARAFRYHVGGEPAGLRGRGQRRARVWPAAQAQVPPQRHQLRPALCLRAALGHRGARLPRAGSDRGSRRRGAPRGAVRRVCLRVVCVEASVAHVRATVAVLCSGTETEVDADGVPKLTRTIINNLLSLVRVHRRRRHRRRRRTHGMPLLL
jgi:hypothetical protein